MTNLESIHGKTYQRLGSYCPKCAIDIHTHWYPQKWLDNLKRIGIDQNLSWDNSHTAGPKFTHGHLSTGPVGLDFIDLEVRKEKMKEQRVSMHALSLSQPMINWTREKDGHFLAALYNDCLQDANESDPNTFVGLATLPMQSIKLSVMEIDRINSLKGIRGIYIATNIEGKDLSDPSFNPIWERLEQYQLPVFLHPIFVIDPKRLDSFYLTNLLGNPFETAIAAAHLIFGGVLDRYPRLDFVLPHAGGAFPWLVGRLNRGWEKRVDLQNKSQSPFEYLKRFYYDTVGYSDDVLTYLNKNIGVDRILLGSDYCFPIAYEDPVQIVSSNEMLSEFDLEEILEKNAKKLLKISL